MEAPKPTPPDHWPAGSVEVEPPREGLHGPSGRTRPPPLTQLESEEIGTPILSPDGTAKKAHTDQNTTIVSQVVEDPPTGTTSRDIALYTCLATTAVCLLVVWVPYLERKSDATEGVCHCADVVLQKCDDEGVRCRVQLDVEGDSSAQLVTAAAQCEPSAAAATARLQWTTVDPTCTSCTSSIPFPCAYNDDQAWQDANAAPGGNLGKFVLGVAMVTAGGLTAVVLLCILTAKARAYRHFVRTQDLRTEQLLQLRRDELYRGGPTAHAPPWMKLTLTNAVLSGDRARWINSDRMAGLKLCFLGPAAAAAAIVVGPVGEASKTRSAKRLRDLRHFHFPTSSLTMATSETGSHSHPLPGSSLTSPLSPA